jgi:hypothetical protein
MIGSRFACRVVFAVAIAWAVPRISHAQVREPGETQSAGEHAGSLGDISRPLGDVSSAVGDGSQTIGESSAGSIGTDAPPVHVPYERTVLSGPVSSISRGPVDAIPASIALAVEEASTGAVKQDAASPLGEQISEPLRELAPLRDQMRKQREEALRLALQQPPPGATTDAQPAPVGAAEPPPVVAPAEPSQSGQRADAEFGPPSDGMDPEGDLHGEDAPAPDDPDPSN